MTGTAAEKFLHAALEAGSRPEYETFAVT